LVKSKETLVCEECNRKKGVHLFYKKPTKRGYSKLCKSCWKKSDAGRNQLSAYYLRTYGITLNEYEYLLTEQGGGCYICGKKPKARRLAVDHDHYIEEQLSKSGEKNSGRKSVRGLLCNVCNEYLGHIEEKIRAVSRMREYLSRPPRFP
jgi:hypothetical protein